MASRDVELFKALLYCDVFRGEHSTGVFSLFKPYNQQPSLKISKAAVPADIFIRDTGLWNNVSKLSYESNVSGKNPTTVTVSPKVMVGHNRHATSGQINDQNAHPFNHGKITMVHNGTLDDQSLLPDHLSFAVDSENIAYSLDKIGVDETVQKLDGAYTLVWINTEEMTLNIIRNKERPFHLVETNGGDWFGASEEDMILWLINRKKYSPTIKRHFECEPGVQYVFDITNGMKLKEERKHELPTFHKTYSYYGGYNTSYNSTWSDYYENDYTDTKPKTTVDDRKSQQNKLLEKHGVSAKMGELLKFEAYQCEPYPKNKNKGKLTGYVMMGSYVEVQSHGFDMEDFITDCEYVGEIISCYEMNYILTVIVKNVKPTKKSNLLLVDNRSKEDSDDDDEDEQEVELTKNDLIYSRNEWESSVDLNHCKICNSHIDFEDIVDTVVKNGCSYCSECDEKITSHSNVEVLRKKLCNGMTVTKTHWKEISKCGWCGINIPWSLADKTEFVGQKPCCVECSMKLDAGIIPDERS